MTYSPNLNHKV